MKFLIWTVICFVQRGGWHEINEEVGGEERLNPIFMQKLTVKDHRESQLNNMHVFPLS